MNILHRKQVQWPKGKLAKYTRINLSPTNLGLLIEHDTCKRDITQPFYCLLKEDTISCKAQGMY